MSVFVNTCMAGKLPCGALQCSVQDKKKSHFKCVCDADSPHLEKISKI